MGVGLIAILHGCVMVITPLSFANFYFGLAGFLRVQGSLPFTLLWKECAGILPFRHHWFPNYPLLHYHPNYPPRFPLNQAFLGLIGAD